MKCLASLVICATLLQVLWIGLSGGQEETGGSNGNTPTKAEGETTKAPADEEKEGETTKAPAEEEKEGETTKEPAGEEKEGETTKAPAEEEEDGETTKAPAEEEKEDCSTYDNRKECCAAGNSTACLFFPCVNADDDVISKECIAANATHSCSDGTPGENLCKPEETPEGGEKTQEVDCDASSSDKNACCTAGNSTACIFFRCTREGSNVTGTLCMAAGSTPVCPKETDTLSANICEESGGPTTGPEIQNATKSPTTGEDMRGQEFDAASFVGGIVLCAGILLIGYFGLKFYRSRQERNYESM